MGIYVRNRKSGADIKVPNSEYLNEYLDVVDINDLIQYNITSITAITKTYLNDSDVRFDISPDLSVGEQTTLSNVVDEYKFKTGYTQIEQVNSNYEHNIKPNLVQDYIFPRSYQDTVTHNDYSDINAPISGVTTVLIDELNASGYTNLTYVEKRIISKWLLNTVEQRTEILNTNELDYNLYRLSLLLSNDQYALHNSGFKNTISGSTLDNNFYNGTSGNTRHNYDSVTVSEFNTYTGNTTTGNTVSWNNIDFTNSTFGDILTRNSSDVNYTETNWNINNVEDGLNKVTDYVENTQGTGRISPEDVLFGLQTTVLKISGGTGYINYEDFHKKITWSGQTKDLTTGYTEGLYYVYVDTNSDVQISAIQPSHKTNISLGFIYHGGFIGVIQQSGTIIQSATNRIADYAVRQGIFIYDNGGKIEVFTGSSLQLTSSPCKIQYGLLDAQLPEINSNDASTFKYTNFYNSGNLDWTLNWHFGVSGQGEVPTNRYNNVTGNTEVVLSGYSLTFTQFSNIVTSTTDLTSLGLEDTYIYLSADTSLYASPVSAVTWTGSQTNITLETIYVGAGGTGVGEGIFSLPKLPAGKFIKSEIVRDSDESMFLVLGQTYYDTEDEAIAGVLPGLPTALEATAIKMAYIIYEANETDLTGKIYDIRPLPYSYREGGQSGGGTTISNHGDLTGLSADDHLQYLKSNGDRNITGIQKYDTLLTFTTDFDIVNKKYVDDQDNLKLDTVAFTGYTATTKTNFDAYSGITDSRIQKNTDDIFIISGITSGLTGTYVEIDTFTGYTATTDTTLDGLQTQIDALSGVTGMSTIQVRRTTSLALAPTYQNILFDVTDIENDPDVLWHNTTFIDNIDVLKNGIYLMSFDSQGQNNAATDRMDIQIVKNATPDIINGGDSYVALYTGEIHKVGNLILAELVAGDYIAVRVKTVGTNADLLPPLTFKMVLLEGVHGEKGDKGADGAGSSVNVFEDGVNVQPTGGTFTTLNFTTGFSLSGGTDQVNITAQAPVAPMALLIDTIGGQNLTNITPVPINWTVQSIFDSSYFSHNLNNSPITILQDGLYEISYNINLSKDTSNTRAQTGVQVRINGTTFIDPTLTSSYERNSANGEGSNTLPAFPIQLVTNDVVEIVGFQQGDAASAITVAGQSFVRINYLG